MGGEKLSPYLREHKDGGSPPRGRGKGRLYVHAVNGTGITPAWAGKSGRYGRTTARRKDHPRVGGEKRTGKWSGWDEQGSPPRGRGKVAMLAACSASSGITPAWAGKRAYTTADLLTTQDHPRVGGEKWFLMNLSRKELGSPPRGRGKVAEGLQLALELGITPAWAGKRLKRSHRSGIFISGPIPFHSVLHRPAGSGGSRAGRGGSPAGQPQNAGPT